MFTAKYESIAWTLVPVWNISFALGKYVSTIWSKVRLAKGYIWLSWPNQEPSFAWSSDTCVKSDKRRLTFIQNDILSIESENRGQYMIHRGHQSSNKIIPGSQMTLITWRLSDHVFNGGRILFSQGICLSLGFANSSWTFRWNSWILDAPIPSCTWFWAVVKQLTPSVSVYGSEIIPVSSLPLFGHLLR